MASLINCRCIGVVPRWVGLRHGSKSSPGSGLGWLGQLYGGSGWIWVDEIDPQTTLRQRRSSKWSRREAGAPNLTSAPTGLPK